MMTYDLLRAVHRTAQQERLRDAEAHRQRRIARGHRRRTRSSPDG